MTLLVISVIGKLSCLDEAICSNIAHTAHQCVCFTEDPKRSMVKQLDGLEPQSHSRQDWLPKANENVAWWNPTLSFCTGSHNASCLLGGSEQSSVALFCVSSHIAKNKVRLQQALTIVEKAIVHIEKHPTHATDKDSNRWGPAQHFLSCMLNRLNLSMELTDCQAAAVLVGLPTETTSDTFSCFNPKAAAAFTDCDNGK